MIIDELREELSHFGGEAFNGDEYERESDKARDGGNIDDAFESGYDLGYRNGMHDAVTKVDNLLADSEFVEGCKCVDCQRVNRLGGMK